MRRHRPHTRLAGEVDASPGSEPNHLTSLFVCLVSLHCRQDPLGKNTLDLAAWDVFFQTALRLKCNLFLVGTNPFPDSTANALAARRGLIISHHHYDLVGSNVFNWPLSGNEWNWENNAGTMSYLWRASIAAQSDYDVIWSVGLRGLNDVEYPGCGTNNPAQQEICGRTVSEAMANQTAWIRSTPGQENSTQVRRWYIIVEIVLMRRCVCDASGRGLLLHLDRLRFHPAFSFNCLRPLFFCCCCCRSCTCGTSCWTCSLAVI